MVAAACIDSRHLLVTATEIINIVAISTAVAVPMSGENPGIKVTAGHSAARMKEYESFFAARLRLTESLDRPDLFG